MGLTRQERQDRIWTEAVALRDKADKERAFTALLEACQSLIRSYIAHCPDADKQSIAIKNARQAIQQAEGVL